MTLMPRVMVLITDLHRGGSPLLLADLAPGLAGAGWQVDVVSIAPRGEVSDLLTARGVPVTSLEARFNRDLSVVPRLVRQLREQPPNILLSILIHANLLAALARPAVAGTRGATVPLWAQSIHTLQEKPAWHWTLQRVLLGSADAFIAPSRAIIRRLETMGAEVPRPAVIPNGIDVPRFYAALPMTEKPWPPGAIVVGSVGRFDPVKRLDVLVQALKLLPGSFHLALAGYGPQEDRLRKLAADLQLAGRVHWVGRTAEPERWYKCFDISCNLSSSEGYGLTLAEAACAGVPVVTCDTPAIRETLPTAASWLPPQPTPQEVASAITRVHHAGPRTRSGIEELQARYGVQKMVAEYDACFRGLLKT